MGLVGNERGRRLEHPLCLATTAEEREEGQAEENIEEEKEEEYQSKRHEGILMSQTRGMTKHSRAMWQKGPNKHSLPTLAAGIWR